ncbi:hypothetical protein [Alienimonas chondri]|uniref:Secreted protein n=1 Tax=Alienimonas chondri TaxID=2681879 RepID=A0ABX1VG70_9PLAN|nr:hypothetical protein [Alienimonas chondri]NNJ26838.1 hypothetical protein [Alienimonas chondri]
MLRPSASSAPARVAVSALCASLLFLTAGGLTGCDGPEDGVIEGDEDVMEEEEIEDYEAEMRAAEAAAAGG